MSSQESPRVGDALGQSDRFLAFQERLSRVARVDRPVLIVGERGTGKELSATRLHYLSQRWDQPFVALNCATLPPTLIETELFGHEAGAFTGAVRTRAGRFESADGGTLFLDEIGAIPTVVQEKILRVVEYGVFERVGSSDSSQVDVRIIAATNADLRQRVRDGQFKADLLDRLSFEVLVVPPLRERAGDIMLLAAHFAGRMALQVGRGDVPHFTTQARRALQRYDWPGNVRELKNVVERAVHRAESDTIGIDAVVFDPFGPWTGAEDRVDVAGPTASPREPVSAEQQDSDREALPDWLLKQPLREAIRDLELALLSRALRRSRYHQRQAAAHLGLTYDQFRGLYRKHAGRLQTGED